MYESIYQILAGVNIISIIVRLLLCVLCGGIIGIERGLRNRPAGFITYVLVCSGSALIMMTNQYIVGLYAGVDVTRLGAQVVNGIGFLGAGTIITTQKNGIKGLTTAAGLWVSAALGLAIGIGFYAGALIACAFVFFTLTGLKKIDHYVKQHAKTMDLYMEYDTTFSMDAFTLFMEEKDFELFDIEFGKTKTLTGDLGTLSCSLGFKQQENHLRVLDMLNHIPGILHVREVA